MKMDEIIYVLHYQMSKGTKWGREYYRTLEDARKAKEKIENDYFESSNAELVTYIRKFVMVIEE